MKPPLLAKLLIIGLAAIALTSGPAAAQGDRRAVMAREMIPPLTAWVVAHTGWHDCVAPMIRFVRTQQLADMYAGENETAKAFDIGTRRPLYARFAAKHVHESPLFTAPRSLNVGCVSK